MEFVIDSIQLIRDFGNHSIYQYLSGIDTFEGFPDLNSVDNGIMVMVMAVVIVAIVDHTGDQADIH